MSGFKKDLQYYKFGLYGFLKNIRLFEPFLILFFIDAGLSYLQIGILYSFREIARNILEIPAGVYADATGRRRSMIMSFSAYILSFFLFWSSVSYALFFAAMLFFAVGDAFRTGTHKAMIFDYLKIKGWQNQKADYYGHTRAFSQFGTAIASVLSALLVFFSGNYRMIFLFSIIPYVLDLINLMSYPKMLDGDIAPAKSGGFFKTFKKVFSDFLSSLKNTKQLKIILSIAWYSAYYKIIKDFIQPIIVSFALLVPFLQNHSDKQRSAVFVGLVYFIIYILTSLSSKKTAFFISFFGSYQKALNILMFGGLSFGLVAAGVYRLDFPLLSVLLMIPVFLIENIRKPAGVALIADNSSKNILATVLSVQSQLQTLLVALLTPLMGLLSDKFGLAAGMMFTTAALLASAWFLRLKE